MKKRNILNILLITTLLSGCSPIEEIKKTDVYEFISDFFDELFEDESISEKEKESISEIISESISNIESSSEILSESESTSEIISESESISEEISISEETSEASSFDDHWSNSDYGNYYSGIDFTKNGTTLLTSLQTLNSKKLTNKLTYGKLWDYFNKTDYDPNNKSKYIAFYQGTSASKNNMNKEHVWPKSHGGNLVEGDIHVIRPTLSSDNSSRGNSFYVEGMNSTSKGWDPKEAGLKEYYRGIAARIIFYCCVANSKLSLVDTSYSATTNSNPDYKMGKLSDLLKWNLEYDIDETELRRNNGAQSVQGNRNPFIDNRDLACKIWGDTNVSTRNICKIGTK